MIRVRYSSAACASKTPQIPIYVLHSPFLHDRRNFMLDQLSGICTRDVTWVTCIERATIDLLDWEQRHCLMPCEAITTYFNPEGKAHLANGTVSLALKHKAAYLNIEKRRLTRALVLEDDAVLPPRLWDILAAASVPADAQLFFLGSYGTWSGNSLGTQAIRLGVDARLVNQDLDKNPPLVPVLKRNATTYPSILGGVGYIVYQSGAKFLSRLPVVAPADIGMTFVEQTPHQQPASCDGFSLHVPLPQYGVARWIIWPAKLKGGTHHDAPTVEAEANASMFLKGPLDVHFESASPTSIVNITPAMPTPPRHSHRTQIPHPENQRQPHHAHTEAHPSQRT
ncbi:MAG: hypothetical protein SGPRY_000775 [Prymnesium sp.]